MAERLRAAGHKIKQLAKVGLSIGALAVGGGLLEGCAGGKPDMSVSQAKPLAFAKYDDAFHRASPAAKFVLQYLRTTTVDVNVGEYSDGDVIGTSDSYEHAYQFTLGDTCLANSAYNISGGSIRASADASGFFTVASADVDAHIPAAAAYAYVASTKPDELVITSGHSDSRDLRFEGVTHGDALVPTDQQTRDILSTYGCVDVGGYSYDGVVDPAYYPSSNYIR